MTKNILRSRKFMTIKRVILSCKTQQQMSISFEMLCNHINSISVEELQALQTIYREKTATIQPDSKVCPA